MEPSDRMNEQVQELTQEARLKIGSESLERYIRKSHEARLAFNAAMALCDQAEVDMACARDVLAEAEKGLKSAQEFYRRAVLDLPIWSNTTEVA